MKQMTGNYVCCPKQSPLHGKGGTDDVSPLQKEWSDSIQYCLSYEWNTVMSQPLQLLQKRRCTQNKQKWINEVLKDFNGVLWESRSIQLLGVTEQNKLMNNKQVNHAAKIQSHSCRELHNNNSAAKDELYVLKIESVQWTWWWWREEEMSGGCRTALHVLWNSLRQSELTPATTASLVKGLSWWNLKSLTLVGLLRYFNLLHTSRNAHQFGAITSHNYHVFLPSCTGRDLTGLNELPWDNANRTSIPSTDCHRNWGLLCKIVTEGAEMNVYVPHHACQSCSLSNTSVLLLHSGLKCSNLRHL